MAVGYEILARTSRRHCLGALSFLYYVWSVAWASVVPWLTTPLPPPSSSSRLVGFDSETNDLSADVLRKYLFGGHVADYMRKLEEEDEEKYKSHFSKYIEKGITADKVSGMGGGVRFCW